MHHHHTHVKKEEEQPPWAVHTPSHIIKVKREPSEEETTLTTRKRVKREQERITFVHPEGKAPWKKVEGGYTLVRPPVAETARAAVADNEEPQPKKTTKRIKKKSVHEPSSSVLLCARNYDAIEAGREAFGLIDQGVTGAGVRNLLIHVRRAPHRPCWIVLNEIRVGSTIMASKGGKGIPSPLRVRFTTPSRYYTPSAKVTSMLVGVNEADWRSLMHDSRRI